MKGRSGIGGNKKKKKACGILSSLPESVALICLAELSRMDMAALAMSSKGHRALVESDELWDLRRNMDCSEQCLYVLLHLLPEPNPRWFIFHPVKRYLNPVGPDLFPAPEAEASFVMAGDGIFVIGGLIEGQPSRHASFFSCIVHRWYLLSPMKIARRGASASLIDYKLYVFGGCTTCDSSNWAEVYDLRTTQTWDFLNVSTPSFNIQQSMCMWDKNKVYAVDEDGQTMSFSPTTSKFVAANKTDSQRQRQCQHQHLTDWCLYGKYLFCAAKGASILWCFAYELDWKEVKGLEDLKSLCGDNDIIHLCPISDSKIAIFWVDRPHRDDPYKLLLRSAEIFLTQREGGGKIWGNILRSGPILSATYPAVNFLYARYLSV